MTEGVEVSELGTSSILTLMLKQMLEKNLRDPERKRLIQGTRFEAVFRAGRMLSTLIVEGGRIRAQEGRAEKADLEVSGDIRTLLELGIGGNPLVPFLRRRLTFRVRGIRGLIAGMRVVGLMRPGRLPFYLRWLI